MNTDNEVSTYYCPLAGGQCRVEIGIVVVQPKLILEKKIEKFLVKDACIFFDMNRFRSKKATGPVGKENRNRYTLNGQDDELVKQHIVEDLCLLRKFIIKNTG